MQNGLSIRHSGAYLKLCMCEGEGLGVRDVGEKVEAAKVFLGYRRT